MDRIINKKKISRKNLLTYVSLSLVLLFGFYFVILADNTGKMNVDKNNITIVKVKRMPFQEYIPLSGVVEPVQSFFLDLSDGGKVIHKYVEEGAMVNEGDPLIKIDNPQLSLSVLSTQSSFLQAQSMSRQTRLTFEQNLLNKQDQLLGLNLELLRQSRTFENDKVLSAKGMIPKNEFETSKEKYETIVQSKRLLMEALHKDSLTLSQLIKQGESDVEMSKQYLNLIEEQLNNLTVKAPIAGQLTSLKCEIGQSVTAGYRLGQIDNIDSFKVRVEIDEHYIARIREGQTGDYEFNNNSYSLKIKTIYPQVVNGRFYVDMVFTGKQPEGIRRGQTVHVKLKLSGLSDAVLIESGAFYSSTGGQWIFVVDQTKGMAERRRIKIGRQNPLFYEVLEGLNPGEYVITSSYLNYADFEKLILK